MYVRVAETASVCCRQSLGRRGICNCLRCPGRGRPRQPALSKHPCCWAHPGSRPRVLVAARALPIGRPTKHEEGPRPHRLRRHAQSGDPLGPGKRVAAHGRGAALEASAVRQAVAQAMVSPIRSAAGSVCRRCAAATGNLSFQGSPRPPPHSRREENLIRLYLFRNSCLQKRFWFRVRKTGLNRRLRVQWARKPTPGTRAQIARPFFYVRTIFGEYLFQ